MGRSPWRRAKDQPSLQGERNVKSLPREKMLQYAQALGYWLLQESADLRK